MNRSSVFVGLLAVSAFCACGESDDLEMTMQADIQTLEDFCGELAADLCLGCGYTDAECIDELSSDCERNAEERNPGAYSAGAGAACLDELAALNCDDPPLNCEGNLAIAECDDYLDGTTDATCVAD